MNTKESLIMSKSEIDIDSSKLFDEDIKLTYEKENTEDKELENILVFCENINSFTDEDFKDKEFEDIIGYYYYFVEEKIKYLEDIQKSFSLKNNNKRLTDIAKYLDTFTIGEIQHNTMDDFGIKISSLLDLLYSVEIILREFYRTNFTNTSDTNNAQN